jgi:hypothetical protein
LYTCVLSHLIHIIISHTESLPFSLASMALTFLFRDTTYDLAMMQKMNWSVCWNSCYWNVWTLPWVSTVIYTPPPLLPILSLSKETQHCQLSVVKIILNSS